MYFAISHLPLLSNRKKLIMKVLHLSTADANGGAAKGAYNLHKALCNAGVESHMLVAHKFTKDPTVISSTGSSSPQKILKELRKLYEQWPLRGYKNRKNDIFSPGIYPSRLAAQVEAIDPDIINLHWVASGLLRPEDLGKFQRRRRRRLVWTLRDMWAFTGGCHYSGECTAYQTMCGKCPALGSDKTYDLAHEAWQRKQTAWKNLDITLAPLSNWLADCARQSALFSGYQIQVIPNAVDAEKYRPIEQTIARDLLGLPLDKKLILFGAISPTADPRKGFRYLCDAVQHLASHCCYDKLELVVFGTDTLTEELNLKLPTTFLGCLHDDTTLALAYAAADVMVMPSIQDNFAKTTIEAMACGTPVVGFNATGLKDSLIHEHNGYAAIGFDAVDLANGIAWVLEDEGRLQALSHNARRTVEKKFTLTHQAEQYRTLYQRLMNTTPSSVSDYPILD